MTLILSQSEFEQIKYFVRLSVANKLRVPDAEYKSTEDLQQIIASKNSRVASALSDFLVAYDRWYQFHVDIDAAGKGGNLSSAESERLVSLAQDRDIARVALITALAAVVLS